MLMPSLALGAPIRSPNALGAPIRSPNAHYEPPKFIMNTSFIMNLIMRFLVFQCVPQPFERPQAIGQLPSEPGARLLCSGSAGLSVDSRRLA